MKVYLNVVRFFPTPDSWRGVYCLDFVRALERSLDRAALPYRSVVFAEGDGTDYVVGGVTVHTFKAIRLPSNVFPFLFSRWNRRHFLAALERAGIRLEDVAVCHGHTANYAIYPLAVKARNPNCLTLLHHHDLQSFGLNGGILRHCLAYNLIEFPVLRRLHEQIDCHVFISEASRRSFLSAPDANWSAYSDYRRQMRGLPWRPARIKDSVVLHNGVDKSLFRPSGTCKTQTDGRFVVGCVGNFHELKDQMTLLRAAKILAATASFRICMRFIGTGQTLATCRAFAEQNGIVAEFWPECPHEELPQFYQGLDLFVLPSRFEGFGCVYTEAHACGVPFIACEGQGIEDILPKENRERWLCKAGDAEDLAAKIRAAIGLIGCMDEKSKRIGCSASLQPLSEDQTIDALVAQFVRRLVQ